MYGKTANIYKTPPLTSDIWHGQQGPDIYHTYEIESELGAGGGGAVYKAWHKRLRKHIVLKQLRETPLRTTQALRNEVEALKNIKSLYIPQVFDFLTEERGSYTVMEYIEGDSLDKLLTRGEVFSAEMIIKWYQQLATALEALHLRDVCHRDIKPSNIIKMPSGDVCLIDFNSALVSGNYTGVVNRSLGYASPEQVAYFQLCDDVYRKRGELRVQSIAGEKPSIKSQIAEIDWKLSDLYSLGAAIYHLLTGKRPVLKISAEEVTNRENVSVGFDSGAANRGTPLRKCLEAVIEKSMRVNPKERFLSAYELRCALQSQLQ